MKKGFTIIELLVAIFILVVGIVGVLNAFPLGVQVARSAKMATVATYLAQEKIEEIISKSYDSILCYGETLPPCEESKARVSASFSSPFYHYWRKTRIDYVDPADGLSTTTNNTGIKKIKVTVYWKSPLKVIEDSIKITTLISEKK